MATTQSQGTIRGANGGPAAANGAAAAIGTGEAIEVLNPHDGSVIETIHAATADEVAQVTRRVRANQPEWEALGHSGRQKHLFALRDWMLDHYDEIADVMQAETGKVRAEAAAETVYLTDLINFYAKKGRKFTRDEKVRPHSLLLAAKKLRVQYRPYPVVGVISPWNFPLMLSLGDAIPALQAGCSVVIKPSEITPLALRMIVDAWKNQLGAPDVLDAVNGRGDTGSALVDNVDFVQFTGSDRTGKLVMKQAADRLTPVSLELGGNDPMIVLDGANLDRAANAAVWGSFVNTGQVCMAVERIFVEEPVYDEFVEKFVAETKTLKPGPDGAEYGADQGAITFPKQMDVIERHVKQALEAGARAETGGENPGGPGDHYPPTILTGVNPEMEVMREETFGPVTGVVKVRDAEEALQLANNTRYGLTGYVFGPKRKAEQVARRIEAGAAVVNDVLVNFLASDVPMGGWKDSGIGFRHGEYGIRKFVRPESIVITRFGGKREPLYYPYTAERRNLLRRLTTFFNGRGMRRLGRGGS